MKPSEFAAGLVSALPAALCGSGSPFRVRSLRATRTRSIGWLIAFGALACGGGSDDAPPATGDAETSTADAASTEVAAVEDAPLLIDDESGVASSIPGWEQLQEPWLGDLNGMVERRVVRAVVTYSKTLFFLDGARPRGVSYEALTTLEKYLNERLGTGHLKVHVVIVPVRRDQLLPMVAEGKADIAAANLTITPERLETVDFADPLLSNVRELVVTGPAAGPVELRNDLSGLEVHVRRSSSFFGSLQAFNRELEAEGLPGVSIEAADELLETEDLLELVNAGVIPATVVDEHMADLWIQMFDDIEVHRDFAVADGGEVSWAVRKNSPELQSALTDFVAEHRQGTLLGNITLRRYLESSDYITNPTAGPDRGRLEAVRPIFEEYAERYGFDPLLIVAQSYQESKLDQSLVSGAGAVGIMQIKPSTAADPNVGIADISTTEDNVHAGVKYLRFLADRYFADADLEPLDEHFFAFAAYNAGPTRVRQLRIEAEELGLDPNKWFRNVERVAARRIGRETVQYVSNIYKYYVAYRRLEELGRLSG